MITHGHFLINDRKVDKPSYCVKPGDVITVKQSSRDFVQRCNESTKGMVFRVPYWLSVDQERLLATALHAPQPDEIMLPFEVDY